jgi:RNA polymerase sigma factor (sigma-70 family)
MNGKSVIQLIRQGDKKPLAEVYKTYRTEFVNWATSHFTCSRDEARDVYQAVIITLYDNIQSQRLVQLSGSLKTYLFAIGKYKILELRRTDNKFDRHVEAEGMEITDVHDWEKEKKENDLKTVEQAMQQLGEPCKTILELYYLHGMGLDELAKHLNYKNSDTIKNIKCRCLIKLRQLMAESDKRERKEDEETRFI